MTQEEKQLLLKDLCARLLYGVMCDRLGQPKKLLGVYPNTFLPIELDNGDYIPSSYTLEDVKPYLRPMSSMTEEENNEWRCWLDNLLKSCDFQFPESEKYIALSHSDSIDWLNAHHFDYRGLIPMGLALEAPEGMYNTKTE